MYRLAARVLRRLGGRAAELLTARVDAAHRAGDEAAAQKWSDVKFGVESHLSLQEVAQHYPTEHPARGHAFRNRDEVLASEICGCFYCLAIFAPAAITWWIDLDDNRVGQTAMCPKCGVDYVIGSKSGLPITNEFLTRMREASFS